MGTAQGREAHVCKLPTIPYAAAHLLQINRRCSERPFHIQLIPKIQADLSQGFTCGLFTGVEPATSIVHRHGTKPGKPVRWV
ncbi:hypothetical protein SKAU_G00183280 [Synaphobranchus kaupii]|uniref:Uncharacterized protein n=1 Tax=Synaphobranchus kaupii TaxID=118154 RepID=A0A9Q1FCA7_SYNKA|nr:hypothetical protein SKAU_G00183280 [Synaphobranchus kaupii]